MYFANNSMQGMDMSMSGTSASTPTQAQIASRSGLESPALAFPIITIVALIVMLGAYWLLKRFTSWQFPLNKKG